MTPNPIIGKRATICGHTGSIYQVQSFSFTGLLTVDLLCDEDNKVRRVHMTERQLLEALT